MLNGLSVSGRIRLRTQAVSAAFDFATAEGVGSRTTPKAKAPYQRIVEVSKTEHLYPTEGKTHWRAHDQP